MQKVKDFFYYFTNPGKQTLKRALLKLGVERNGGFGEESGFSPEDLSPQEYTRLMIWWKNVFLPRWSNFNKLMNKYGLDGFRFYAVGVLVGWVLGLLVGLLADWLDVSNALAEGAARFLAGSGDTLGGWVSILIVKLRKNNVDTKTAEVFAWGTLIGTLAGPLVHTIAVLTKTTQNSLVSALYAILYSNGDNWCGVIAAGVSAVLIKKWREGMRWFWGHPFYVANICVLVFLGSVCVVAHSLGGWQATNVLGAAIENVLLNNDSTLASLFLLVYIRVVSVKMRRSVEEL